MQRGGNFRNKTKTVVSYGVKTSSKPSKWLFGITGAVDTNGIRESSLLIDLISLTFKNIFLALTRSPSRLRTRHCFEYTTHSQCVESDGVTRVLGRPCFTVFRYLSTYGLSGKSGPMDQVALHYYYTSPSHW